MDRAQVLAGIEAKLRRAEKHHELLGIEWQRFLNTHPHRIEFEQHADAPYTVTMWWRIDREIPPDMSAIMGDLVHNLRSALDHAITGLLMARGLPACRHHAFPIFRYERDWIFGVRSRSKKAGPGPLDGIPATSDAWAYIERLQPYQRGHEAESDPLYLLNALSNRDKHRIINLSLAYPAADDALSLFEWNRDLVTLLSYDVHWTPDKPLKDDTKLVTVRFAPRVFVVPGVPAPLRIGQHVKVKDAVSVDIAFGDGKGRRDSGLIDLIRIVSKIVRDCEVLGLQRP